ncbi:MAG: inositol monophosphatase family protein [Mariprofundales bacterium]|nr:inositol monophosphatase family protein [Mariprofundales bacterium]
MSHHLQSRTTHPDMDFDTQYIDEIIRHAGQTILLPAFQQHTYGLMQHKTDGSMVTDVDHKSQETIRRHLERLTPSFAFIGEEMEDQRQQSLIDQRAQPCWVLDPLDGTSNFIAGMPCFAISLGLIAGEEAVAGWVYDPIADEMFAALPNDPHLYCNNRTITPQQSITSIDESIGFIDFKRLEHNIAISFITTSPYHSCRNLGSCALEWAWLASGRAQFIIHGGESLWDFAAGVALANRSGATISSFTGTYPLQRDTLVSSILAASNQQIHSRLNHHIQTICHFK